MAHNGNSEESDIAREQLDRLKPALQKSLEVLECQAHDMSLPASIRRRSARQLERRKAIIAQYPFLMQEQGDGTKKSG
jgi:hypothetical protein